MYDKSTMCRRMMYPVAAPPAASSPNVQICMAYHASRIMLHGSPVKTQGTSAKRALISRHPSRLALRCYSQRVDIKQKNLAGATRAKPTGNRVVDFDSPRHLPDAAHKSPAGLATHTNPPHDRLRRARAFRASVM